MSTEEAASQPPLLTAPRVPFLGSLPSSDGRIVILGAPLDLTESFRPGTRLAPQRIRYVSDVLETYSPPLGRDLSEVNPADAGDIELAGLSVADALAAIETTVGRVRASSMPIMLGGEHTATLPAFSAVTRRFPDAMLLQLDAHLDLRPSYAGEAIGHATWLYHAGQRWGFERVVQLGVRSGTREEFQLAVSCAWSSADLEIPASLRARLESRPVYVTIDIDVLDPSVAPGTGCPEPGGPDYADLQRLLHSLAGLQVVGLDVVEVLPEVDHGDITSIAAAKLVREAALLFG